MIPLRKVFVKSAFKDMSDWFAGMPNDASWYVISDYCLGDRKKQNDTVSFSILLNHDKLDNIKEYINSFAPKDIKSSRSIAPGFLQYINSPVIFHVTFLINRNTKLLKDYATKENMKEFLPVFTEFVKTVASNSSCENGYFESIFRRVRLFETEFSTKTFNAKLARQIYLVATFAGLIFYYLTILKKPSHIAWVSDRDALIDRSDGFIYDLAYFMFVYEYSSSIDQKDVSKRNMIDKPKFTFVTPDKSGRNYMDELVRLPDYLAGTMADYNFEENNFTKDKFYTVLHNSLENSKNHAIIQVYGNGNKLSTRRLGFSSTSDDSEKRALSRKINNSLDKAGLISYVLNKDDILSCDFSGIKDIIAILSRNRASLLKNRGTLLVLIAGYDEDPREVYDIPEICHWYRESIKAGIPWFYFLGKHANGMGLNTLLLCSCDIELKFKQHENTYVKFIDIRKKMDWLKQNFNNLNKFTKDNDIPLEINQEMSDIVYEVLLRQ